MRAHVAGGAPPPEHRNVTVAFLRFEGTDELIAREGPERAAARLDELVAIVQRAVDEQDVCFLESDVDADGGKVMLTAGAPRIVGDDEERMLLALRRIVEAEPPLPVRIGVNGGNVFSGDVGTVLSAQVRGHGRHGQPRGATDRQGACRGRSASRAASSSARRRGSR